MSEPSYTSSNISLVFDGGLADSGQLHFYEYSRCVYAYSRFLQTIEYYRRQGRIAEKIVGASNTDILIRAPIKGSFIIDATVRAAQKVLPFLTRVPFEAVVAFVIDTIKEDTANTELTQRLAKIALKDGKRSAEPPEALKTLTIRAIAEGDQASTRDTLELASWALGSSNTAIARADITQQDLEELSRRSKADLYRQDCLEPFSEDLQRIPTLDLARLTSRVRPMLPDMGLPLRKSAKQMSFAAGEKRQSIARLDYEDIRVINSRSIDETASVLTASVKSYDRETGHGRLRIPDNNKVYPFSVLSHLRKRLNSRVIAGLDEETVDFVVQEVKDRSDEVTSYLVSGIGLPGDIDN